MYNSLHRLILRQAGFPDAEVIAPNQDSSFYSDFCKGLGVSMTGFLRDLWISIIGIDLLHKVILRLHPLPKTGTRRRNCITGC